MTGVSEGIGKRSSAVRVLVDADACPVRREVARAAERFGADAAYFANSSQEARESKRARVVRVSDRPDAADFAIATRCRSGDIVVTDDIGLAALAASKGARALSSRGRIFRPEDIPLLLEERHRSRKARFAPKDARALLQRRAGGRTRGPAALTPADRRRFAETLAELLRRDKS